MPNRKVKLPLIHVYRKIQAFEILGALYGQKLIADRQFTIAAGEWRKPTHPEFEQRNAWSLYNAVTEALKSSQPHNIMEKHVALHDYLQDMPDQPLGLIGQGRLVPLRQ